MAKTTTRVTTKVEKPKASARSSKTTEVEVVEESSSIGFEGGVAIVSALLLIAAIVMVDSELGALGKGLFFKS